MKRLRGCFLLRNRLLFLSVRGHLPSILVTRICSLEVAESHFLALYSFDTIPDKRRVFVSNTESRRRKTPKTGKTDTSTKKHPDVEETLTTKTRNPSYKGAYVPVMREHTTVRERPSL